MSVGAFDTVAFDPIAFDAASGVLVVLALRPVPLPVFPYGVVDVDVSTQIPDPAIFAKSPTSTIYVQRLAGQALRGVGAITVVDSATGQIVAMLAVPAPTPLYMGARGTPLKKGSHLLVGTTGTVSGRLHIDAYQK